MSRPYDIGRDLGWESLKRTGRLSANRRGLIYASSAAFVAILLLVLYVMTPATPLVSTSGSDEKPPEEFLQMKLNRTTVATIIETRNLPVLLPVLHNFLALLPQDWPIVMWCSKETFWAMSESSTLWTHFHSGKLSLRMLPKEYHTLDGQSISKLMISPWFWQQFGEAEYMLTFQVDSVLCSRTEHTLESWVGFDFVGHPIGWALEGHMKGRGGNGGLSMRKISSMLRIATEYEARLASVGRRPKFSEYHFWSKLPPDEQEYFYTAEDAWFSYALVKLDDEMGPDSTIRWPVREGRVQTQFAYDIWGLESWPIDLVRPIGLHTGAGSVSRGLIEYDGDKYSETSEKWMTYCPELAYLRFIPP